MKRMLLPWGVMALLVLPVTGAAAQPGPVRLTVTKITKGNMQRFSEIGWVQDRDGNAYIGEAGESVIQVGDFVHYHIELALMSPKALPALRIEWALLVRPAGGENPQVIQGENMGKLDLASRSTKFECDTQTVHVRTKEQARQRDIAQARSWSPQPRGTWRSSAYQGIVTEILGYSVEVLDGDRVVASAAEPANAKRKIELLRGGEGRQ
jgi:hypothetical protein